MAGAERSEPIARARRVALRLDSLRRRKAAPQEPRRTAVEAKPYPNGSIPIGFPDGVIKSRRRWRILVEESEMSSSKGSLPIWMQSMTSSQGPAAGDPRSSIRRLRAGVREWDFEFTSRWPLGGMKEMLPNEPKRLSP